MRIKIIVIILIFFINMNSNYSQISKYGCIQDSYNYQFGEFKKEKIAQSIEELIVSTYQNIGYYSGQDIEKLDLNRKEIYKFRNGEISEFKSINKDSSFITSIFDKKMIQKKISFTKYNSQTSTSEYFYNSNNLLEKVTDIDENNNIKYTQNFKYDAKNRLVSALKDENLNFEYFYDEKGGYYEITFYVIDNNRKYNYAQFKYFSENESIQKLLIMNGLLNLKELNKLKPYSETKYKYDFKNRIVLHEVKNFLNPDENTTVKYLYENDQLKKTIHISIEDKKEDIMVKSYEYKDGNEIFFIASYAEFDEYLKIDSKYDIQGNVIERKFSGYSAGLKGSLENFKYKYDENNNWIEKIILIDNKIMDVVKREIKYLTK
ncbi:MAG: hypothetical protein V4683_04195 [Bacteroidota bacterium]